VLQARLARIQAGEDEPDAAAVDGHVPLHGRNPVSRHGPALAHGVTGEIKYVLTRKPRNTMKPLAIAFALGLLYLGYLRLFQWDKDQQWLPYLGLWVVSVVMGGSVCINAMSFDAMRVRAALDTGARLWHLLVIKNLALLCIVAPLGFLLSALLAWRAGDSVRSSRPAPWCSASSCSGSGWATCCRSGCPPATSPSGSAANRAASSSS